MLIKIKRFLMCIIHGTAFVEKHERMAAYLDDVEKRLHHLKYSNCKKTK